MFLLAVLISSAAAQTAHTCKSPVQFAARFNLQDQNQRMMASGVFQYDSVNRATARKFQATQNGVVSDVFQQINIWSAEYRTRMTQYNVDLTTSTCNVVRYSNQPFKLLGVPPQSNFSAEMYLGGQGESVDVLSWQEKYLDYNGEVAKINQETVSFKGCWPVAYMVAEPSSSGAHIQVTQFFDVLGGLTSSAMFVPPTYCKAINGVEKTSEETKLVKKEFIKLSKSKKSTAFKAPAFFF
eukprot:gb/GEZN01013826.1/.p1 GENE.gb/GEZN01013826.1/~~gb/GEZN01013826.1/.p1  ORF type:complete len:239 (+),score=41.54 gb/GEZN01013826.1/:55-771(+)